MQPNIATVLGVRESDDVFTSLLNSYLAIRMSLFHQQMETGTDSRERLVCISC